MFLLVLNNCTAPEYKFEKVEMTEEEIDELEKEFGEKFKNRILEDYESFKTGSNKPKSYRFSILDKPVENSATKVLVYLKNGDSRFSQITNDDEYVESFTYNEKTGIVKVKIRLDSNGNDKYEYFFDDIVKKEINMDTIDINFFEHLQNFGKEFKELNDRPK